MSQPVPPPSKHAPALSAIEQSPEWAALREHQAWMRDQRIAQLFQHDPQRVQTCSLEAGGLLLDWSKHLATAETLERLLALARRAGLEEAIARLCAGEAVNNTEKRPALHVALRSPRRDTPQERMAHEALERIEAFAAAVQEGSWTGYSGRAITDIVNIGIGGSDLGPAMVYAALAPYHLPGLSCHFVSNVDPAHLAETLLGLDPETTLFVLASKTFGTLETMQNAQAARQWLLDAAEDEAALPRHFVAVSANLQRAETFGVAPDNIFPMWDWVGGRYSLWSAIGLPLALGLGMEAFRALLAGAHAMDEHFRSAPLQRNLPVILGLLAVWYLDFFGAESQVVLPYAQALHLLPAFLQQLDMESLGKSVRRDGSAVGIATGGILWGSAGTNGQHSFHQLLHQGTHLIPADFIAAAHSHYENAEAHRHLLANCFAQSQALMLGKSLEQARAELLRAGLPEEQAEALAPHRAVPGNRPSSTILMERLEPATLGSLIAAYEHKVYVQSVIQQINAFDQWGVELGKELSSGLYPVLSGEAPDEDLDPSTRHLIRYCRTR